LLQLIPLNSQVSEALLRILSCYLAESLSSASAAVDEAGSMPFAVQIRAESAAVVAILLCLVLQNTAHLWMVVYQQFLAAGCSGLLLELLIPHILQDQLTSLDPAIMQVGLIIIPYLHTYMEVCTYHTYLHPLLMPVLTSFAHLPVRNDDLKR
jgi:hypothetical protein